MTTNHSIPPMRELPDGRLGQRKQHLLAEISREREPRPHFLSLPHLGSPRRRVAPLALALGLLVMGSAVAATATQGFGLFNGAPVSESDFSAQGRFLLSDIGAPGKRAITLVGSRAGTAFYRIERADGTNCWIAGDVDKRPDVSAAACPPAGEYFSFPSKEQPILDFSEFEAHGRDRSVAVPVKLVGLAADPVRSVGLVDASGKVIAATEVVNNIYSTTDLPNTPARQLEAFDDAGNLLYNQCAEAPCP